jgi:hypothetical protein
MVQVYLIERGRVSDNEQSTHKSKNCRRAKSVRSRRLVLLSARSPARGCKGKEPRTRYREPSMAPLKLLLSTFNINGKDLDHEVLAALLAEDLHADVYMLALQEFPYPPAQQVPSDEAINDGVIPRHRYSRSGPVAEQNAALYGNLKALLPHVNVVADVAMGEPEVSTLDPNGKKLDWYGFVRLIILVREGERSGAVFEGVFLGCWASDADSKPSEEQRMLTLVDVHRIALSQE